MKPCLAALIPLPLLTLSALAAPSVYVDGAGDFNPSNPAVGAVVTWKPGTRDQVTGLTFGTDAFTSVQSAVDAVDADGTVFIAAGTYFEGAIITIGKNLSLEGDGEEATILSGNNLHPVINIGRRSATVTVAKLAAINGWSGIGFSGGIFNRGTLSVNASTLSGNSASNVGGGIFNLGTLSVNNSTLSGNSAQNGGGIFNIGTLSVNNSTLSGNSADSDGGGIFNGRTRTLSVNNSTLSGNSAGRDGGGISNNKGHLTIIHCTITRNTASFGGGVALLNSTSVTASIIAGNTNNDDISTYPRRISPISSGGHNLIGAGAFEAVRRFDQTGDQTGVTSPGLAPLSDNGGPTLTHALITGSPAIDAGDNALIPVGTTTDQRSEGFPRIFNDTVDIGAFELSSMDIALVIEVLQTPLVAGGGSFQTFRVTASNNGPSDANNVVLSQSSAFPAGVTVIAAQTTGGLFANEAWTLDLAANQSAVLTYTLQADAATASGVAAIPLAFELASSDHTDLNAANNAASASVAVISGMETSLRVQAEPLIERQSGLLIQKVTVTNNNALAVPSFRLKVSGLPADASVFNAAGTADGVPYLLYNQSLAAENAVTLTVELFRATLMTDFTPQYEIELLPFAETPLATSIAGFNPSRMLALANGDFLIEIPSVPGTTYAIEYSEDMVTWTRVQSPVTAVHNRLQWIDNGPPKTRSHPTTAATRFYRFSVITD